MGIQERKEREREARREEILNAAHAVFIEKGLTGSTVDDIAAAAELSKGTIYLYFHSKEDLYLAVMNRGIDIMQEMFERAIGTGENPIKLIWNLGEAYYAFFQDHRDYFRMFSFFESPQFHSLVSEEMMAQCMMRDKKTWDLVSGVIKRAIDAGLFHAGLDPLEVGIILWSNSNGLLRQLNANEAYWLNAMGIDLRKTLRKSNGLLVEAMMTEKAKQLYPDVLQFHETDAKER
jgi:AcrR family transcriptional regulator